MEQGGQTAIGFAATVILLVSVVVAMSGTRGDVAAADLPTHRGSPSATPDGGEAPPTITSPPSERSSDGAGATEGGTGNPITVSEDAAVTVGPTEPQATPVPAASTEPAPEPSPTVSDPPPTPSEPGAIVPVPAGTYHYDTTGSTRLGDGDPSPMPPQTTLSASPAAEDGTQVHVRDLRDEDGFGQVTTSTYRYADGGVLLERIAISTRVDVFGGITDEREFVASPPAAIAAVGDTPGRTRSFTMDGDGTTLAVTLRVVRTETLVIDGVSVDTVVVEQVVDLSGDVTGRSTSTTWVRTSDLLPVREETESDVTSSGLRVRSEQQSQLGSLEAA